MEAFLITAKQLSVLSLLFLTGYIIRKKDFIKDETIKGLSFMMLNVFTPATVFMTFQMEFSKQMLSSGIMIVFCFAGTMLLGYAFAHVFTKVFNVTGSERQIWFGGAMISNIIFIGMPVIGALYGDEGVFYLSFEIVGWNLISYTLGIYVFKEKSERLNFAAQARTMLMTPVIIACFLGMIVFFFQLKVPTFLLDSCRYMANGTIPVSMIVSGALVGKTRIKEIFTGKNVYVFSVIKLILIPIVALFALSFIIKDEVARNTVVLSVAMPIATTVTVFAEQFIGAGKTAAKYWIVTTILSLASLPFVSLIISLF